MQDEPGFWANFMSYGDPFAIKSHAKGLLTLGFGS